MPRKRRGRGEGSIYQESDGRWVATISLGYRETGKRRRRKVTGIVLAGISTSIGVESTARAANERGYELTVVTDAITDTNKGAHLNSLRAIFPQIAELATTEEVLTQAPGPHTV